MIVLLVVQFHLVFGSGGRGAEETSGAEAIWTWNVGFSSDEDTEGLAAGCWM